MNVVVLIVTHKRRSLLERCLNSLHQQEEHNLTLSIFCVINGKDPQTHEFLESSPFSLSITSSEDQLSPGAARNLVLRNLPEDTDYVLCLDDDVELPPHYFSMAQNYLKLSPTLLGGPDLTHPKANHFQRLLGLTQQSPMCTAHTRYRHSSAETKTLQSNQGSEFILCNLWFHKKVFRDYQLYFDERFFRNEENIIVHQISGFSQDFIFTSDLFVFHEKKSDLQSLARAVFSSGVHRSKSFIFYPDSFNFIHLAPLTFIFYLFLYNFLGHTTYLAIPLYLSLFLSLFFSYRLTSNLKDTLSVWGMHYLIIVFYGIGTFAGFFMAFTRYLKSRPRSNL